MTKSPPTIFFLAGDPSGDVHASHVVRCLMESVRGATCFGIGGPFMQKAGFSQILPFERFNIMGFAEVLAHLPFIMRAERTIRDELIARKPSVVVLVDYPGFNMRILKMARRLKIPVLWYIPPKVWAWKKKRAAVIGRIASHVSAIFPFETGYFEGYNATVSFAGNPLVEQMDLTCPAPQPDWNNGLRIAVVPGSRRQEIAHMLGPMIDACLLLKNEVPRISFTVSKCSWLPGELFSECDRLPGVTFHEGTLADLFTRADAALVTSGTATLEAALAGVPHLVVYRTSAITYWMAKRVIQIPWIGLPNIVAGKCVVPEIIQDRVTGRILADELKKLVVDKDKYRAVSQELIGIRDLLGSRKPSGEVARKILEIASRQA